MYHFGGFEHPVRCSHSETPKRRLHILLKGPLAGATLATLQGRVPSSWGHSNWHLAPLGEVHGREGRHRRHHRHRGDDLHARPGLARLDGLMLRGAAGFHGPWLAETPVFRPKKVTWLLPKQACRFQKPGFPSLLKQTSRKICVKGPLKGLRLPPIVILQKAAATMLWELVGMPFKGVLGACL